MGLVYPVPAPDPGLQVPATMPSIYVGSVVSHHMERSYEKEPKTSKAHEIRLEDVHQNGSGV